MRNNPHRFSISFCIRNILLNGYGHLIETKTPPLWLCVWFSHDETESLYIVLLFRVLVFLYLNVRRRWRRRPTTTTWKKRKERATLFRWWWVVFKGELATGFRFISFRVRIVCSVLFWNKSDDSTRKSEGRKF